MEAAAVDELVEKGEFRPQVAQAIAEALDITIKAANLVTVPMLDARFAQSEAKMEARFSAIEPRFSSIEKALEAAKAWAVLLYAGLTIALFSALALDHHWLVNRDDQMMAQTNARFAADQARSDARFAEQEARSDQNFHQFEARMDAKFDQFRAQVDAKFDQARTQADAKFDQFRTQVDARLDRFRDPNGHATRPGSDPGRR